MDYLRPYSLAHPVQSFTVLSKNPEPQYGYEDSPPTPEGGVGTFLSCIMYHVMCQGLKRLGCLNPCWEARRAGGVWVVWGRILCLSPK